MVEGARASWIRSDLVNGVIGGLVVALTALFVRSSFGFVFGIAFGIALIGLSRKLSVAVNRSVLLTLGMTSSLYAILDIKSDVLDRPHLQSDAFMLGELTGLPTQAWGIIWILVALAVTALLFRRAYRKACAASGTTTWRGVSSARYCDW